MVAVVNNTQQIALGIIWTWLLISFFGLLYALKLWWRARRDVQRQAQSRQNGAQRYLAEGNLRRVQARCVMFVGFLIIGTISLLNNTIFDDHTRTLGRVANTFLLLLVNLLLLYNARADEHHDHVLRILLRRDEQRRRES